MTSSQRIRLDTKKKNPLAWKEGETCENLQERKKMSFYPKKIKKRRSSFEKAGGGKKGLLMPKDIQKRRDFEKRSSHF